MKPSSNKILTKLLTLLIDEWGYDSVTRALEGMNRSERQNVRRESVPSERPTPTGMVLRQKLPKATKDLLLSVAGQYEAKRFLPTIADVRNFLEIRGARTGQFKQRPEAFRRVLEVLLETPHDRLDKIVQEGLRSGPSQLGPISDAIRSTNDAMRSTEVAGSTSREDDKGSQVENWPSKSVKGDRRSGGGR
ncbi:hypothetical protein [Mesorhizobium sp. ZC-5]|uniref:hypothetical protein n=1 Tax=Mesorhizobium sp. ZC-5 TaxID=2986066 RepID=UPI0021E843D4|nr:hypothetical protein [Mesorhizobium sp. ZC-5]MCV3239294.1 hypothetical protein [Mesorhizobium sp. ZC-5]